MERLRDAIPLLQSSSDLQTVHIHATNGEFRVLPEKLGDDGVAVECDFKGVSNEALAVSVDRRLLLRALELGLSVFKWTAGDSHAPITATDGQGSGLFIFMPLRGGKPETIKQAVARFNSGVRNNAVIAESKSEAPKGTAGESTQPTVTGNKHHPNNKETNKMIDESKIQKKENGFKVVEGAESDPFEEMLAAIAEARGKAREVYDSFGVLAKGVRELQRREKAKEREFKSTRELLGKLKKVSGF
jgi:hypothetical protein